ncbi:MAG: glycosyltransferase family 4 protein [Planctomycetes bacterium]|nr:glycosyltransferase family 4 protein [Planctomycetota bacterium]
MSNPSRSLKIAYIAAGAAGSYCGGCTRDLALVRELIRRGHDVKAIPLYSPMKPDDGDGVEFTPLFFGGISLYLQQESALFRMVPNFMKRLLDSPSLINKLASSSASTDPAKLGPLTLSMLSGTNGKQRDEILRLVEFMKKHGTPDIVNITNSLLSGIAPFLKEELGCKIVCNNIGEDNFLEQMGAPYINEARKIIRQNAKSIDLFISTAKSYGRKMTEFLGVAPARMRFIRPGVNISNFASGAIPQRHPFTVGYLSSINPRKGLDLLVNAVAQLVNDRGRQVFIKVAGKIQDRAYFSHVMDLVKGKRIENRFEYLGELNNEQKADFYKKISLFALPSRAEEALGMSAIEAQASGVPVVLPFTGVFPEMLETTRGGLLFEMDSSEHLAARIDELMDNPEGFEVLSMSASKNAEKYYSLSSMGTETEEAFLSLIS